MENSRATLISGFKENHWSAFDIQPWPGPSTQWTTAFVIRHVMHYAQLNQDSELIGLIEIAVNWLANEERNQGGWGYNDLFFVY